MLRRIQWISLRFPLENVLNSIGKRFNFHWKTQRVRLGCAAEARGCCREDGFDWSGGGLDVRCAPMRVTLNEKMGTVSAASY